MCLKLISIETDVIQLGKEKITISFLLILLQDRMYEKHQVLFYNVLLPDISKMKVK